jgi:two-component system KDP operon response regulator KdpE
MSGHRVLVVDDEGPMRAFVRRNLEARGYEVAEAANGLEALATARHTDPDVVILDIMMPHLDGYEVCRRLRKLSDVPVIVLTAMGDERDIVAALDSGADDCLTKPFGVEELLARLRSVLRRAGGTGGALATTSAGHGEIRYRGLRLDLDANRAWIDGTELDLTRTERSVLCHYAKHLGKTVPHRQVLAAVWGEELPDLTHYVRIYVCRLRAKIEAGDGEPYFHTEHGLGYRLGQ